MSRIIHFTKMQGAGNDYVYLDCLEREPHLETEDIQALSDRHFGVGGDGVVMILPSNECDYRMRIFNQDGSEAEMCGNATRCIAKYLYERGICCQEQITLETLGGMRTLYIGSDTEGGIEISTNMGVASFKTATLPTVTDKQELIEEPLSIDGHDYTITCVSVGNPHAVIFVDEITDRMVLEHGPMIERHELFPKKTNVEFVKVVSPREVDMRVWERGSGETLACGTAASAVLAAGYRTGRTERELLLHALGGDLQLRLKEEGNILLSGPAEFIFEGTVDLEHLRASRSDG